MLHISCFLSERYNYLKDVLFLQFATFVSNTEKIWFFFFANFSKTFQRDPKFWHPDPTDRWKIVPPLTLDEEVRTEVWKYFETLQLFEISAGVTSSGQWANNILRIPAEVTSCRKWFGRRTQLAGIRTASRPRTPRESSPRCTCGEVPCGTPTAPKGSSTVLPSPHLWSPALNPPLLPIVVKHQFKEHYINKPKLGVKSYFQPSLCFGSISMLETFLLVFQRISIHRFSKAKVN